MSGSQALFWCEAGSGAAPPCSSHGFLMPTVGKPHLWFVTQALGLSVELISPTEAKPHPWLCCLWLCWAKLSVQAEPAACLGDRALEILLCITVPRQDHIQGVRGELGNPTPCCCSERCGLLEVWGKAQELGELCWSLGAGVWLWGFGVITCWHQLWAQAPEPSVGFGSPQQGCLGSVLSLLRSLLRLVALGPGWWHWDCCDVSQGLSRVMLEGFCLTRAWCLPAPWCCVSDSSRIPLITDPFCALVADGSAAGRQGCVRAAVLLLLLLFKSAR